PLPINSEQELSRWETPQRVARVAVGVQRREFITGGRHPRVGSLAEVEVHGHPLLSTTPYGAVVLALGPFHVGLAECSGEHPCRLPVGVSWLAGEGDCECCAASGGGPHALPFRLRRGQLPRLDHHSTLLVSLGDCRV